MFNFDMQSRYLGSNSGIGLSPRLWKKFFKDQRDGNNAYFRMKRFDMGGAIDASGGAVTGAYSDHEIYAYQGATITDAAVVGGGITIGSDGDNEGLALGPIPCPIQIASSLKTVVYEARIKTSTISDTKHGIFAGLIESGAVAAGVPLATDGTLADKNFIGFHRLEGDGDKLDVVYKADGQTQQSLITDAITLVADTWIKVGFVYDPTAPAAKKIKFFYDGTELTTYVTKALMDAVTFPDDVLLGMCFAVMNATGSTPGTSSIAWHACGQALD